jgi:Rrf2 family protein
MLKFSKKVEYALISMLYMAEQNEGQLTTSRELAATFNIPQELAGKVLQSLAKSGCISSVQGVKGGYLLAKEPDMINLADIIVAVDGPVKVVNCVDEPDSCSCEQLSFCNMRNPMETIQDKLMNFFTSITLKDLQTNYIPYDIANPSAKVNSNVDFIDRIN